MLLKSVAFVTILVLTSVAGAAVKKTITLDDAKIDYFGVLGLKFEDQPTNQQIVTAFRAKIKDLHPDANGGVVQLGDAQKVVAAKTVLTDESLRRQYLALRIADHNQRVREFVAGQPQTPTSMVGMVDLNGILQPVQVGLAFNTAHKERSVEYFRRNPQDNQVVLHSARDVDGPPRPSDFSSSWAADRLDPKWKAWENSAHKDLAPIEAELKRIATAAPTPQANSFGNKYDIESFLFWWFAQPESIIHSHLANETLERLPEDSTYIKIFLRAAVNDPAWRTRDWVQTLMEKKDAFFALAPVMGTAELSGETDLIETLFKDSNYAKYGYMLRKSLTAAPEAIQHPEWFKGSLNSVSEAYLFLDSVILHPMWREQRPELITEAIVVLAAATTGNRDQLVHHLLTKPDSVMHPEWLEILIKTDKYDYLTIHLNALLALDMWYNHPYLRAILKGSAPTVEGLRQVNWVPLRQVPSAQAAMFEGQSVRVRPALTVIDGGLSCSKRLEPQK